MRELDTSIKAKIKEQNAARGKTPYKTVEELDDAVKRLEAGVESGKLKLVDERKSLAEICRSPLPAGWWGVLIWRRVSELEQSPEEHRILG